MLAPLDNQVIFKKAFTDPIVFEGFVRDITGVSTRFGPIEVEKKFEPPIGQVNFAYDIFAESLDERVVVEIQKEEYDHHFDRFLHYHNMAISQQIQKGPNYKIDRVVYTIVLLTSPYTLRDRHGTPIKDDVLISQTDPKTLEGEVREIYGHQLILLNPNHPKPDLPDAYSDWFELILESTKDDQDLSHINRENEAVARAMSLIEEDDLTPEEREEMKIETQKLEMAELLQQEVDLARDAAGHERAEKEKAQAEKEKERTEKEKAQADNEIYTKKLRELGVDPDDLSTGKSKKS